MPSLKIMTIALAVCTGLIGCYASLLWLKASQIGPSEPEVRSGDELFAHMQDIGSLKIAAWESGNMNARAARWTAVAVCLGTASSVLGSWPM
jgi:hypothetical protein